MGTEGPNNNKEAQEASQQEKSAFSQKRTAEEGSYNQEYSEIINSTISPENIQTFHDDVLNKLIKIVGRIVDEYKNNHPDTNLTGRELEDEALKEEGLQDIPSVLDAISKRKIDLRNIEEIIMSRVAFLPEVMVPPGEGGIIPGPGESFKERDLIPRLTTLLYILENDLSLDIQDEKEIQIVEGIVRDDMMRKHPYFRVLILSAERVVYICEEEHNATFVFDKEELDRLSIQIEELDVTSKAILNDLIEENPQIGVRIIKSKLWRANIQDAITNEFGKVEKELPKQKSDFESREIFPKKKDGWESASSLRGICNTKSLRSIKNYAQKFRIENSQWFEMQENRGKPAEHFHPDLVEKIIEHFMAVPLRKNGWESATSLIKIGKSFYTIKKYAEQFRHEHPEWFEEQKAGGTPAEYYHPALVEKIRSQFPDNAVPIKRNGWESTYTLRKICNKSDITIRVYAGLFRVEHPEWFEIQKNVAAKTENYHPDLVKQIIEHFKK